MSTLESKLSQERSTTGRAQCAWGDIAHWSPEVLELDERSKPRRVRYSDGARVYVWRSTGLGGKQWELESSTPEEAHRGDE